MGSIQMIVYKWQKIIFLSRAAKVIKGLLKTLLK